MLQRAASNAYSWWWASHIRTKQSKWLEQNLQDMEEKVQIVLKLIEEDGDSFAKRAEMYYKKRPELINFVEESYRAYRALADRYDHMSTELQNANNTIAYVFPEQVQFAMEEEEEEMSSKLAKKNADGPKSNAPKVPKIPKDLKGFIASATKKFQHKKPNKMSAGLHAPRSGLSKSQGLQEIDKLQKTILALQTEKEFIKGSYESGVAKYWEIDQEIREMQERVCSLQDEFGAGIVIEDDDARTLMASVALKSCQDTLARLKEKQEQSAGDAAVEQQRIQDAREKLKSLKGEISRGLANEEAVQSDEQTTKEGEGVKGLDQAVNNQIQERQDLEVLCEKIKEQFDINSTLSVTEMAEKIDDLANKVFSLESAVSSQTSLTQSLRSETDELQAQIRGLEDDKSTLINEKRDMRDKLKEMEERIFELQNMSQKVEEQNINLKIHFTEAHVNLDHLSEKLPGVKPDEEGQVTQPIELGSLAEVDSKVKFEAKSGSEIPDSSLRKQGDVDPEEKTDVEPPTEVASAVIFESPVELTGQEGAEKKDDSLGELLDVKPLKDPAKAHEDLKEQEDEPTSDATIGKLSEEQVTETTDEQKVDSSLPDAGKQAEEREKPEQVEKVECDISTSNKEAMSQSQTRDIFDNSPEKVQDLKIEGKAGGEASSDSTNNSSDAHTVELKTEEEDEPDWKELFMNGLDNREKTLLTEYTSVLRNFKEAKRKLGDQEEKKGGDSLYDVTTQLTELKSANAKKDEQILALRQTLRFLQPGYGSRSGSGKSMDSPRKDKQVSAELKEFLMEQPGKTSEIEEKFRGNIDELLEENLDFWMRFSSTFQQIQKFETEVKDLQCEAVKLEDKVKKHDGSSTPRLSLKSDAKPLYKHLREIHAELTVWIEKSTLLKEELKSRFSSLCDIQEEITAALTDSAEEEDFNFTSYQAAKFQGEVLNMKQENNKVADELQAGLDHVTTLQLEVEKSLAKLNERFKLSGSKNRPNIQLQHSESRSRVPLRSFIFGVKPKKQKNSIFSCMHPALHRKYGGLRLHPSK